MNLIKKSNNKVIEYYGKIRPVAAKNDFRFPSKEHPNGQALKTDIDEIVVTHNPGCKDFDAGRCHKSDE